MRRITISLLGPFYVRLDEAPVQFPYDKVRALLAYLVTERDHPHRRTAMSAVLWPDAPERRARQSLSQAISSLRTALGERDLDADHQIIETTRQTVCIKPSAEIRADIQSFENHLRAAHGHTHTELSECSVCLDHLSRAVDQYRGDFLEELFLSDSAPFEEWALMRREEFRRQALQALELLCDAHAQRGDHDAAAEYARRQLEIDPWRESAHRHVMRGLAIAGHRNAALAQYEACRDILAAELGAEPTEATTALYTAIRQGAITADQGFSPVEDHPPAPGSCPFKGLHYFDVDDADLFFGREALTERLVRRVAGGEPFLAVIGASGSGKSSLLRAGLVAQLQRGAIAERYSRQVKLLTPTADPVQSLCRALLHDDAPTDAVKACRRDMLRAPRALQARLADRQTPPLKQDVLLVIDQFEELFILCEDLDVRRAFIDNLIAAVSEGDTDAAEGPLQVVLALRADFYHHCADYEGLR
ncbi:MAG: BTAD domain-containing putative transcriptional regulator, partial [Anaerolineae bacterium]